MNKNQIYVSVSIILISILIILSFIFNIFQIQSLRIDEISTDVIYRGYEDNLIDGNVVISVNGEGFKEGDKIYVNDREWITSIANSNFLSFILDKEIYSMVDKVYIKLCRPTPKGNILLRSNSKTIQIIDVNEKKDNSINIREITPAKIRVNETEGLIENSVAISILGSGFQVGDVAYINGEPQKTAFGNDGFLSCLISKKHYARPAKLELEIKRKIDSKGIREIRVSEKEFINVVDN